MFRPARNKNDGGLHLQEVLTMTIPASSSFFARVVGAATPPQPPCGSVPPENRRRSHDDHRLEQRARSGRQRRDQPSVWSAKSWTRRRASEHGELIAIGFRLRRERAGRRISRTQRRRCGSGRSPRDPPPRGPAGPALASARPTARALSFCGAQPVRSLLAARLSHPANVG